MLLQHIIKIILVRKNIYISIGNWSKQFKAYQKLGVFHSWGEVDGGVRVRERSWNLAGKAGREFHLHLLERSNCGPGENSIIHLLGNKVKWTGLAAQRLPESEYSNAFKGHANSKKKKKKTERETERRKKALGKEVSPRDYEGKSGLDWKLLHFHFCKVMFSSAG